jgi:ubiquitin-conjugating enzyme E2 G1
MTALRRLNIEYKQYLEDPNYFYSIEINQDNPYNWNILLIGPPESIFEGAILECEFIFPINYPHRPPEFKFITKFKHPNIYTNGKVCISILKYGIDDSVTFGYESINERWSPSQNVNTILMSILSLLLSPNLDSPADIEATKLWKENFNEYKKEIYKIIVNN